MKYVLGLLALLVVGSSLALQSNWAVERSDDEAAIHKAVSSYVEAYNRRDAKALAEMWSDEAVYKNPATGAEVIGREAIEQEFAAIFKDASQAELKAETNSVQFVSPNVAIERGTARVVDNGNMLEESTYAAVYVKREGKWLLDRIVEEDLPAPLPSTEKLNQLQWLVGSWLDEDDSSRIESQMRWTKNQSFLFQNFALSIGDQIEMSGVQVIGWDPKAKHIRSWVFDSDGGIGEAVWNVKGDTVSVKLVGTLADGRTMTATNVMTKKDDQHFTWQSVNRTLDGELLPNVDPVVVVRQAESTDGN